MDDASEFKASSPRDLARLQAFVDEACERAGADPDSRFALRLAVEEVFTNIQKHGYGPGGGPVTVELRCEAGRIFLTLRDRAPAFDPTSVPAPEPAPDWRHRKVGGFGLHLVKSMMDEVRYQRSTNGENDLTLVRNFARIAGDS